LQHNLTVADPLILNDSFLASRFACSFTGKTGLTVRPNSLSSTIQSSHTKMTCEDELQLYYRIDV